MTTAPAGTSRIGDVLLWRDVGTGTILAKHLRTGTRVRLSPARAQEATTLENVDGDPRVLGQVAELVEQRSAAIPSRWALANLPISSWWIEKGAVIARLPCSWRWAFIWLAASSVATAAAVLAWGVPAPRLQNVTAGGWALIAIIHGLLLVSHEIAHAIVLIRWGGRPRQLKLLVSPGVLMAVDASDLYALPRATQRIQVVLAGPYVDLAAVIALYWVQWALGGPWSILLWLQAILLVVGLWPFAYTDGYVLFAAVFDIPGLNRVSRDCLMSLLKGGSRMLRAEASVRGWPAIGALCAYAAVAAVAKWLPLLVLLWFLLPYFPSVMRTA